MDNSFPLLVSFHDTDPMPLAAGVKGITILYLVSWKTAKQLLLFGKYILTRSLILNEITLQ